MPKISRIEPVVPILTQRKKAAAYCRVSVESERMMNSISAQISYYSSLIQKNPDWEYAGVYADSFISGTNTAKRNEFNRMLADCENGKIDIILCKSISRFARNTVDLLQTVRHLKELGIEVQFEKEHIHSLSGDGELMLSILASFAQEESRSISENVKWGTVKRFKEGIPNGRFNIYGYKWEGDKLVIVPEEAENIRFMYREYMKGASRIEIGRDLMSRGIYTRLGKPWVDSNVKNILTNITYTGNLLFQKEYCEDPITKHRRLNRGELPQYFVENTHEAIIPMEDWQAVQEEFKRRRELGVFGNKSIKTSCFTSKVKCCVCGKSYRRSGKRKTNGEVYYVWICQTKSVKGAKYCGSKIIPEITLKKTCAEILETAEFNEELFAEKVKQITVIGEDILEFHFYDGSVIKKRWKSTAKTDCWTEERRKDWGERHKNKADNPNRNYYNEFTGFIKCGNCGENYRGQPVSYADGTKDRYWRCCEHCGNTTIKESTLKEMVCNVLGLDEFSESKMDEVMDKVVILNGVVTFHFKDGHTECLDYEGKKKGYKHTDEYKSYMHRVMKERWQSKKESEDK